MERAESSPFGNGTPFADYNTVKLNRTRERYKHIIAENLRHIEGKRILDLAAHDGRWTWAALKSGAAYVEAVEGRPDLVEQANKALNEFPRERYRFSQGDVFAYLEELKRSKGGQFDTILCLGIFYHINEHFRLLQLMADVGPAAIILDSAMLTTEEPIIRFKAEATDQPLHAIPGEAGNKHALVGTISRGLLKRWAGVNGWHLAYVSWDRKTVSRPAGVHDYLGEDEKFKNRRRFTCVLTPA